MQQLDTRFKLETDHKNGACAVSNTLRTGYGKNQVFIFRLKICYKKSHKKAKYYWQYHLLYSFKSLF